MTNIYDEQKSFKGSTAPTTHKYYYYNNELCCDTATIDPGRYYVYYNAGKSKYYENRHGAKALYVVNKLYPVYPASDKIPCERDFFGASKGKGCSKCSKSTLYEDYATDIMIHCSTGWAGTWSVGCILLHDYEKNQDYIKNSSDPKHKYQFKYTGIEDLMEFVNCNGENKGYYAILTIE